MKYTKKELDDASKLIFTTINNCEKMKLKFTEESSHHTLLKNRIRALKISWDLINNEHASDYKKTELELAIIPILSIIKKMEKAISKYDLEHPNTDDSLP